jgi:hypothetical protein
MTKKDTNVSQIMTNENAIKLIFIVQKNKILKITFNINNLVICCVLKIEKTLNLQCCVVQ